MDLAPQFGLSPQVIEKDYVLGWMLAGLSAHAALEPSWVFKGGTCLKKCYFETYRFSEDLDFTLLDAAHLNQDFLIATFEQIADWIYQQAGIEIPRDTIRFDFYDNPRGNVSVLGRVGYRGPMQRGGDAPRIRFDLTNDEILALEPSIREVNHPYSDKPELGIQVRCYSFEEVFAEKVRALAERTRPRDLYDVIHLYRHHDFRPDRAIVIQTLQRKCEFKRIAVPTMATVDVQPARTEIEADWEQMLAHQLPALPSFDQFWQELSDFFDWLHGIAQKPVRPTMRLAAVGGTLDESWQPPAMAQAWNITAPLEVIRFAGSNRLCVELGYQNSRRLIEPYSLRRTKDGNLLLYAVRHRSGEDRSYRVDRIESVDITETSFIPRYAIELTTVGPVSAPPVQRVSRKATHQASTWGTERIAHGSRKPYSHGPKFVYECNYCGRRFTRKTRTSKMRPHKDKSGYPCSGRTGYLVDTKY